MKFWLRYAIMTLRLLFLIASISLYAVHARADAINDALLRAALALQKQIAVGTTIAIRPLTEEETGIPKSFLSTIMSGMSAALVNTSDGKTTLIARDRLDAVWKDAREFSNKDFSSLVASAGADVLIVGEMQATMHGLIMSWRAFQLKGSNASMLISASSIERININWEVDLGFSPSTINKKIQSMADAMQRLASAGGLVAEPRTPVDFYHNARILAQRGESDLAVKSYLRIFDSATPFADPVEDLVALLSRNLGQAAARQFIQKTLSMKLSRDQYYLALQITSNAPLPEVMSYISDSDTQYLPLLAAVAPKILSNFPRHTSYVRAIGLRSIATIQERVKAGDLYSEWIDQLRVERALSNLMEKYADHLHNEEFNNIVAFKLIIDQYWTAVSVWNDLVRSRVDVSKITFTVVDQIDLDKPLLVCIKWVHAEISQCADYSRLVKVDSQLTNPGMIKAAYGGWFPMRDGWVLNYFEINVDIEQDLEKVDHLTVKYTDKDGRAREFEGWSAFAVGDWERSRRMWQAWRGREIRGPVPQETR